MDFSNWNNSNFGFQIYKKTIDLRNMIPHKKPCKTWFCIICYVEKWRSLFLYRDFPLNAQLLHTHLPEYFAFYSRFWLIWTLLIKIWKNSGGHFAPWGRFAPGVILPHPPLLLKKFWIFQFREVLHISVTQRFAVDKTRIFYFRSLFFTSKLSFQAFYRFKCLGRCDIT